jgi:putative glycosyltransferase (TIGR04372 family)
MLKKIIKIIYKYRIILRTLFFIRDWIYPLFALPLVLFIRLIRPIIWIRTEPLYSMRIGHFTENIEMYLCEKENGLHKNTYDIFFHSFKVSNVQLKRMWNKHPSLRISWIGLLIFYANRFYPNSKKYNVNTSPRDFNIIFEKSSNHLELTKEEKLKALNSLRNFGINEKSKLIGMIARDSAYLKTDLASINFGRRHNYRNSNIDNYLQAAKLLSSNGYFVLRMGSIVESKFVSDDANIQDYSSSSYRSDLLDVYIAENCKFFISGNTGLDGLPIIYRKPIVFVNWVPLQLVRGWYSKSLIIFKKHWLIESQRFMTFSEIIKSGAGLFYHSDEFTRAGIELIENTQQEITDVVLEMDERLNNTWVTTEDDVILQDKFWSMFPIYNHNKVFKCKVGRNYLRDNFMLN